MTLEQCPYQVHDEVKGAEGYLENLALFPKGNILRSHSLSTPNAGICELVINGWNCISVDNRAVCVELELNMVDIVMNKNIALNTCLFNSVRTETIVFHFVSFWKRLLFRMLQQQIVFYVVETFNMF